MSNLKRAIVLFPKFENVYPIEQLRKQFDPLALTIKPHITVVFPFESDLQIEQLHAHVWQAIQGIGPFKAGLCGITGADEEYLFLNVKKGNDEIIELHDRLYSGLLAEHLCITHTYIPHLTVGRLKDKEDFSAAFETTKTMNLLFQTIIEEVAVYRIANENSIEAVLNL